MSVRVARGDIAAQSADALVDAAGTNFRVGSATRNALERAADRTYDPPVLPARGCGGTGCGPATAVRAIGPVGPESPSGVRVAAYGDPGYETVRRVAEGVRGGE